MQRLGNGEGGRKVVGENEERGGTGRRRRGGGGGFIRFNDTIEGPRAPAVKPGRITQA